MLSPGILRSSAALLLAAQASGAAAIAAEAGETLAGAAQPGGFGVTADSPIGSRQALEESLRASGLSPRPPEERRSEDMGGKFRVVAWVDPDVPQPVGDSEHVRLLLGLDGALRGLTGSFTTQRGSQRVCEWLGRYWQAVAGEPPRFERQAAESEWMPASERARLSAPGARGEWVKIGASESVRVRMRERR